MVCLGPVSLYETQEAFYVLPITVSIHVSIKAQNQLCQKPLKTMQHKISDERSGATQPNASQPYGYPSYKSTT